MLIYVYIMDFSQIEIKLGNIEQSYQIANAIVIWKCSSFKLLIETVLLLLVLLLRNGNRL